MTLEELRKSQELWVLPQDICEICGCNAQAIRQQAKANALPYKFIRSGNRTKILRTSFLEFMEVEN